MVDVREREIENNLLAMSGGDRVLYRTSKGGKVKKKKKRWLYCIALVGISVWLSFDSCHTSISKIKRASLCVSIFTTMAPVRQHLQTGVH